MYDLRPSPTNSNRPRTGANDANTRRCLVRMSNLSVLIQRLRRARRLRFALAVLLVFLLIAGDLAPRLSVIEVWAQPPSPTVTAPVLSLTVPAAPNLRTQRSRRRSA